MQPTTPLLCSNAPDSCPTAADNLMLPLHSTLLLLLLLLPLPQPRMHPSPLF
jgi:hypothetical protein